MYYEMHLSTNVFGQYHVYFQIQYFFPCVTDPKFNDFPCFLYFNKFQVEVFIKFNDFFMILQQISISTRFQELWEPCLMNNPWGQFY